MQLTNSSQNIKKTGKSTRCDLIGKRIQLKPAPSLDDGDSMFGTSKVINRRQFLKYGFNTATGVLAASLGVLGFSAILLPPGADSGGSNNGVIFWAKGREDEAWYGANTNCQ